MEPFTRLTAIAAPLMQANVDTDTIIPQAFCKRPGRTGFGPDLFHHLRYFPDGSERPDFVLNRPPFRAARILIAGGNFGCGSSREAAVWALAEFGIRCVIAPGFADIFAANCVQNGVLPAALPATDVAALAAQAADGPLTVELADRRITAPDGTALSFEIDPYRRERLLNGLDEIAITLTHEADIRAFEQRLGRERRWHRPAQS